jgi:transcriptional regulator with XRE-family HTH domain
MRRSPPQRAACQPTVLSRVPGLRREEVAQLAGVSVNYYTRIEQGESHQTRFRELADEWILTWIC